MKSVAHVGSYPKRNDPAAVLLKVFVDTRHMSQWTVPYIWVRRTKEMALGGNYELPEYTVRRLPSGTNSTMFRQSRDDEPIDGGSAELGSGSNVQGLRR